MKNYNFLFKPAFYIFSLVAGSWLVLKIENLSPPSEKNKSPDQGIHNIISQDEYLSAIKKITSDYRNGKIDSSKFYLQMEELLSAGNQ